MQTYMVCTHLIQFSSVFIYLSLYSGFYTALLPYFHISHPSCFFTVNIVHVLVFRIIFHIPLSITTFPFTAYPVCVCDKYSS